MEVLKGPQGTLFGRNATGGLIHMITKDPTQELSGNFRFTYANYDKVKGEGYLAGGLTDTIRADIAVQYSNQGKGWGRNVFLNRDIYTTKDDFAVRSKWIFEPSSATRFTLIGDYSERRINPEAALVPGTTNVFNPTPQVLPGRYDAISNRSVNTRRWMWFSSSRFRLTNSSPRNCNCCRRPAGPSPG